MPQSLPYTLLELPRTTKPGAATKLISGTANITAPIAFGAGVLAPLQRDGKGDFANADDISLVRSNVRQVLGTLASSGLSRGELQWRPEFGTTLQLLRHRNMDETLVELARTYVVDALRTWLFRVRVKDASVELDFDASALRIRVLYDILGTNERSVLVTNNIETVELPIGG